MNKSSTHTRLIAFRILLILLILLNMGVILGFSKEDGEVSAETSQKVTTYIAQTTVPNFENKPADEQKTIVKKMDFPVRKIAHMTEFGTLASLTLILLLTWKGHYFVRWGASMLFALCFAVCDEWSQNLSDGRHPSVTDVLIDTAGAVLFSSFVLLLFFILCKKKILAETEIDLNTLSIGQPAPTDTLRLLLVSDLHGQHYEKVLAHAEETRPDAILIPGDLCEFMGDARDEAAYDFLGKAAQLAPTFYSLGNHEIKCYHKGNPWRHPTPVPLSPETVRRIRNTGVTFLGDGESASFEGFTVCALGSGINGRENKPNAKALARFDAIPGPRILLCHHPEYYMPYIKDTSIELTVSGHAHGGQWRPFGRGIYAPGQGLLPRYTGGLLDGRCLISRGVGNHTFIPRLFNRPEVILFTIDRGL